jgi:hypothetical protein
VLLALPVLARGPHARRHRLLRTSSPAQRSMSCSMPLLRAGRDA